LLENDDKLNKAEIYWYNTLYETDPENFYDIIILLDDIARKKSALPGKTPLTNN
jgi:hypothetical protein